MKIKFTPLPMRAIIDYAALRELLAKERDGMIFLSPDEVPDSQRLRMACGNYGMSVAKAVNPKGELVGWRITQSNGRRGTK
jgi:hypothetical protein